MKYTQLRQPTLGGMRLDERVLALYRTSNALYSYLEQWSCGLIRNPSNHVTIATCEHSRTSLICQLSTQLGVHFFSGLTSDSACVTKTHLPPPFLIQLRVINPKVLVKPVQWSPVIHTLW